MIRITLRARKVRERSRVADGLALTGGLGDLDLELTQLLAQRIALVEHFCPRLGARQDFIAQSLALDPMLSALPPTRLRSHRLEEK